MKFQHAPSAPTPAGPALPYPPPLGQLCHTHPLWASHASTPTYAGPAMLPHPRPLGQLCFHTHPHWASYATPTPTGTAMHLRRNISPLATEL